MSIANSEPADVRLEFDLVDRLQKSLRVSGYSVAEMAEFFDMNRNSIGNWINGRVTPDTRTLRLWAMRTGVPYEWLCPRLESNQRPRD